MQKKFFLNCLLCLLSAAHLYPPPRIQNSLRYFKFWDREQKKKCRSKMLITPCQSSHLFVQSDVWRTPLAADTSSAKCCREGRVFGQEMEKEEPILCAAFSHHLKDAIRRAPVWSGYICSYFGIEPHHSRELRLCLQDLCTVLFIHSCVYWFCVGCVFFALAHMPAARYK